MYIYLWRFSWRMGEGLLRAFLWFSWRRFLDGDPIFPPRAVIPGKMAFEELLFASLYF